MKVNNRISEDFNVLRMRHQNLDFTRKEMYELLANNVHGFPKSDYIISLLVKRHALIKIGGGRKKTVYRFTSEPVHIGILSECVFGIKEYSRIQSKKYYNKVNKPNSEITGITPITEEYCIKFLKDRGYRVLKKVTEFKEI